MRITNAGIIGNAFFNQGLSFDPSFEYPPGSGMECLNYVALWVGARLPSGEIRVSGGPNLEWRPTLDPEDRVRTITRRDLGTQRLMDDDGDGRIDEDLGLEADQIATASYSDTEPGSVVAIYPNGETHVPLHLSVRQTAMAWGATGFDNVAGLRFEITNRGAGPLRDVYIGLYADLDSRLRSDRLGHLNDRVTRETVSALVNEGTMAFTAASIPFRGPCVNEIRGDYVCLYDGVASSGLPAVAVLPLDHTTDPLAFIEEAKQYAVAPGRVSLQKTSVFQTGVAVGPPPILDTERYDALRGLRPGALENLRGDYSTLVSCGPFQMRPGTTIEFAAALIAGAIPDSVRETAKRVLVMYHGITLNLQPDSLPASERDQYRSGATGTFGHEACVEPPPGVVFVHDPHCTDTLNYFLSDVGVCGFREVLPVVSGYSCRFGAGTPVQFSTLEVAGTIRRAA